MTHLYPAQQYQGSAKMVQPPGYPSKPPMSAAEIRDFVQTAPPAYLKSSSASRTHYDEKRQENAIAQLWYYGMKDTTYAPLPSLVKMLKDALKSGRISDNAPRLQEYKDAMRLKEEAFQACTGPTERAKKDVDLFMSFYFLINGRPDRSKTPQPLALKDYKGDFGPICKAAHPIPGLETAIACHGNSHYTVCLGWDGKAVNQLSKEIELKFKAEEEKKKRDGAMEKHCQLVKQTKKPKAGGKEVGPGQLSKCIGSYIIESDDLESGYGTDPLTIDIHPGPEATILIAAVDFGSIEGTMLLSFDEEELDGYIGAAKRDSSNYDDDGEDDEDEEEEEEASLRCNSTSTNKRKAPTAKSGRSPKKPKVTPSNTRRLHYRLKGRETGEGEMFYDPYKGYFDFTDGTYTAFKGKTDIPYIRTDANIEGFKVDVRARKRAEAWSSFSAAAYERERVARWH